MLISHLCRLVLLCLCIVVYVYWLVSLCCLLSRLSCAIAVRLRHSIDVYYVCHAFLVIESLSENRMSLSYILPHLIPSYRSIGLSEAFLVCEFFGVHTPTSVHSLLLYIRGIEVNCHFPIPCNSLVYLRLSIDIFDYPRYAIT